MKHDFANARRGAALQDTGKTRITMFLDNDVLEHFRNVATANGRGYQTEINAALRQAMASPPPAQVRAHVVRTKDIGPIEAIAVRLHRIEESLGLSGRTRPSRAGLSAVREPAARYAVADAKAAPAKKRAAAKPAARRKPKA